MEKFVLLISLCAIGFPGLIFAGSGTSFRDQHEGTFSLELEAGYYELRSVGGQDLDFDEEGDYPVYVGATFRGRPQFFRSNLSFYGGLDLTESRTESFEQDGRSFTVAIENVVPHVGADYTFFTSRPKEIERALHLFGSDEVTYRSWAGSIGIDLARHFIRREGYEITSEGLLSSDDIDEIDPQLVLRFRSVTEWTAGSAFANFDNRSIDYGFLLRAGEDSILLGVQIFTDFRN